MMWRDKRRILDMPAMVRSISPVLIVCFFALTTLAQESGQEISDETLVTNRPIRNSPSLTLTVGQTEGDLRGSDDKVIQAGIDYLNRLGGGTLHVLPGVYLMQNALYLGPNLTLRGSGTDTVLQKAPSLETALVKDSDWFEFGVHVENTKGFEPGGGIMLRSSTGPGVWQYDILKATITAVKGNVLFVDRLLKNNFWMDKQATAATIFPLITANYADDVRVEDLILDGSRDQNAYINGIFAGAVFLYECHRWHFSNVIARNYNGDGFSLQVSDDIQFNRCQALNNADMGFHAGSGSQRPVLRTCVAQGNSQGLFFCWGVSDGHVEDCVMRENRQYGVSIGHRDTDNVIRDCIIERNGQVGILFRQEPDTFKTGYRNRIEHCLIIDNGGPQGGVGIEIQGSTSNTTIVKNRLGNRAGENQKTAIRISSQAENTALKDNTFFNCPIKIEDQRLGLIPDAAN